MAPIEPSAHSEEFVHDLGSRRPLEHFLAPLGHDVRTEAPSGIATGIASPAVARSEGPELEYSHPVDRGQAPAITRTVDGWPAATQRATAPEGASAGQMPVMEPVRTLQPVQRAPAPAPTEAEPEIVPEEPRAPEVARAVDAEPTPAAVEPEAVPEEEIPPDDVQRAPVSDAPLVGRRRGLGEPLTSRPPTARETPPAPEESLPLSARGKKEAGERAEPAGIRAADAGAPTAGMQRAPAAPGSEGGAVDVAPLTGETPPLATRPVILRKWSTRGGEDEAPSEAVPDMPISRASTLRPPGPDLPTPRRLIPLPAAEGADEGTGAAEGTQRAAEPVPLPLPAPTPEPEEDIVPEPSGHLAFEASGPPPDAPTRAEKAGAPAATMPLVAPLVSARPLSRVQRASETPPEPVRRVVERQTNVDLREVQVHREASSATAAREISARAFTTGGEVHVPADHGSLESGEGRALVAHELVHAAQQRRLGPSLPSETTPEGQGLETEARSMESAWRSAPEMPLVSRAAGPEEGQAAPVLDPGAAAVAAGIAQREADGSVTFRAPPAAGFPAPVQRADETLTATAPEPAPEREEEDLGPLADKLYERISQRLREDLRNLRERAGRLADV